MQKHKIDILHLQEVSIESSTFEECTFLSSSYELLTNNSVTGYGIATLIRNNLEWSNHRKDTEGRFHFFDIDGYTFGNFYPQAGLDNNARRNRESLLSAKIPGFMTNIKVSGAMSGDWNCITRISDATNNSEQKISPSLKSLISTFGWSDTCIQLNIKDQFTRYYSLNNTTNASRLDRTYTFGTVPNHDQSSNQAHG